MLVCIYYYIPTIQQKKKRPFVISFTLLPPAIQYHRITEKL